MEWTKKEAANGQGQDLVGENGFLKGSKSPPSASRSAVSVTPPPKTFEGKDAISYATILRTRNKFDDALAMYKRILERDNANIEAHIGKGICLQMQNMGRLAFDSFAEAIRLDPQNACALTHCGILYKDEGRLVEAAEVCGISLHLCLICRRQITICYEL